MTAHQEELQKQILETRGAVEAIDQTINALTKGLFPGGDGYAISQILRFHQFTLQATRNRLNELTEQLNVLLKEESEKTITEEEPKIEQPAARRSATRKHAHDRSRRVRSRHDERNQRHQKV